MKGIIVLLLVIGAVFLVRSNVGGKNESMASWEERLKTEPERALVDIAALIDKEGEGFGNSEIAFKGTAVGPGKTLTLNFMLQQRSAAQVGSQEASFLSGNVAPHLCKNNEVQLLNRHGVMVKLALRGNDGGLVTMPRISKKICEQGGG